ncbi:MAG TPA: hypothetical protein ENN88_03835 [Candidatus Coatesbacteria bacterium]|nr:hypothetical protein [Candidatus Coatesbacteria bacterium]
MDDFRDRIADDRSELENRLARLVPGYRGYKELKTRRDADRLLRELLVGRLDALRVKLREMVITLTNNGLLELLRAVDAVEDRLETVTDAFRYADYGYSGKTAPLKVTGEVLDRLYEYDEGLLDGVERLERSGEGLGAAGAKATAVKEALLAFDNELKTFAAVARDRSKVLGGIEL